LFSSRWEGEEGNKLAMYPKALPSAAMDIAVATRRIAKPGGEWKTEEIVSSNGGSQRAVFGRSKKNYVSLAGKSLIVSKTGK